MNFTAGSGASTRTSRPVDGSYSRIVAVALGEPNGHSLETTRLPPGAIARSRGLSSGSLTSRGLRSLLVAVKRSDGVVTLPGGTDSRGQVQLAAIAEAESSWERNGAVGQERFAFGVESRWQGQDRAAAPQGNAVPAVRCECTATGVQALFAARVQSDVAVLVEREHPVIAAGDVYQITGRAQAEAARISDPGVVAERPRQFPAGGEVEKRAVSIAVRAAGARDQNPPHGRLAAFLCW